MENIVLKEMHDGNEEGRDYSHSIHHVKVDLAQIRKDMMVEKDYRDVSLQIVNLKYGSQNQSFVDVKGFFDKYYDVFKYLPYNFILRKFKSSYAKLNGVNFKAYAGRVTAVIGPEEAEITTLFDLIGGRRKYGTFNGDISINGLSKGAEYIDNVAYCRDKFLTYSPGLTYRDTLVYCAFMLLPDKSRAFIDKRVDTLLKILGIWYCRNRIIPEFHSTKGELGRDLRLLCIACEIVAMPPIIIIKNPALDLHVSLASTIYDALQVIANLGHVVVCSIPRPNTLLSRFFDDIVVVCQGYSIYSAPRERILDYFSSETMGYTKKEEVDTFDFVLDIARMIERPNNKRVADPPELLQSSFEESEFNVAVVASKRDTKAEFSEPTAPVSIFSSDLFKLYGYVVEFPGPRKGLYSFLTVLERASILKFKDRDSLRRHFGGSVILALIIGYIQYNQGQFGYYLQNFIGVPYPNTANVTALCFFVCIFSFVQQGLNMHTICQKLQMFRHEQKSHHCSALAFTLGTYIVEIAFSVFFSAVFATIIYFCTDLGKGFENYLFFTRIVVHMAACGVLTALVYGTILQKEILARDFFLLTVFFMILVSGFPFQLSSIPDNMVSISKINPCRWGFQCLMLWKFHLGYNDPEIYLTPFGFGTSDKAYGTDRLDDFVITLSLIFYVLNFPGPMLLSRMKLQNNSTRDSTVRDSKLSMSEVRPEDTTGAVKSDNMPNALKKQKSTAPVPVIFAREGGAGSSSVMSRQSFVYKENELDNVGPVVTFEDLTYCIKDPSSPGGFKVVLNKINGQFGYGKFSLITGAFGSGKSSLLHILAGNYKPIDDISGNVYYNNKKLDQSIPLWQRCSLVEATDELHRDLNVFEIFHYAILLRTLGKATNINQKIFEMAETLHLKDQLYTKIKLLKPGARRRVAIGEELLNGSNLLFIDEPTGELEPYEESVVMAVLRDLVNNDKTVIASVQYPHSSIYSLFDVVLLMSQGRIIYQGNIADVSRFFTESPFQYDFANYNSPGEFLVDIAGGFLKDHQNSAQIPSSLESYYKTTIKYEHVLKRVEEVKNKSEGKLSATNNPLFSTSGTNFNVMTGNEEDESAKRQSIAASSRSAFERNLLKSFIAYNIVPFFTWHGTSDLSFLCSRFYILMERELYSICSRRTLLVGSTLISLLLGGMFALVMGQMGDYPDDFYNTTSFYAVSTLVLLLSGVQYISYIYRRDLIYLKEHSRGLYTNFTNWIAIGWPIYVLRIINAICFSLLSYGVVEIDDLGSQKFQYFLGACLTYTLAGIIMVELVVHSSSNVRSCYFSVPGLIFFQFAFSGLFVKTSTLPDWLGSWVTSISMIRWAFQGNFINEFKGADFLAPQPPDNPILNPYTQFLSLFSWGGKTKEFCFNMLLIFIFVFKGVQLLLSGLDTIGHRCGRQSKQALLE